MKRGEELALVPEPDNQFDPNAVRIEKKSGILLGYVPAKTGEANLLATLIREGTPLKTIAVEVDTAGSAWRSLYIGVTNITEILTKVNNLTEGD